MIISRADAVLCPMIEMIPIAFIFIKQNESKMLDEKCNSCGNTKQLHDRVCKGGELRRASSPKALFDVCECELGMFNNMP